MQERLILPKAKFKFIHKVGIELEGGWENSPPYEVHHDGSVHCEGSYKGESHTEPADTMEGVFKSMKERYPQFVDDSCGMHVHISTDDLYYSYLTDRKFYEHIKKRMVVLSDFLKEGKFKEDYDRFVYRLGNNNRYCRDRFHPEAQIWELRKPDSRYTILNYCYSHHKTMECRLFPMFMSFANARMAVYEYLMGVEEFLSTHKEQSSYRISIEGREVSEPIVKEDLCV